MLHDRTLMRETQAYIDQFDDLDHAMTAEERNLLDEEVFDKVAQLDFGDAAKLLRRWIATVRGA